MKKIVIGLMLIGALARIGFWIKSGSQVRSYHERSGTDLICDICDDVFSGIGDLCDTCVDVVQKIGRKMKTDV